MVNDMMSGVRLFHYFVLNFLMLVDYTPRARNPSQQIGNTGQEHCPSCLFMEQKIKYHPLRLSVRLSELTMLSACVITGGGGYL